MTQRFQDRDAKRPGNEPAGKPLYEKPGLIDLAEEHKAFGDCGDGSGNADLCDSGNAPVTGDCQSGTSVMG